MVHILTDSRESVSCVNVDAETVLGMLYVHQCQNFPFRWYQRIKFWGKKTDHQFLFYKHFYTNNCFFLIGNISIPIENKKQGLWYNMISDPEG